MSGRGRHFDAIVVGAGLSGLTTGLALADAGLRVGIIAKGGGYLHFTSGCIDVFARDEHGRQASDPMAAIEHVVRSKEAHPYTLAGTESLVGGIKLFREAMADEGLPFVGHLPELKVMPTAIGATRPTCLVPASMDAGDMSRTEPMLVVGFKHFRDFYPPYLAANLERFAPFPVRHLYLDVPEFDRRHLLPLDLARALDGAGTREAIARMVKSNLADAGRVGFPAVLGLDRHREVITHLQNLIGRPVFEIPTLPPSVPGIRINSALRRRLKQRGTRIEVGFWAHGRIEGRRAVALDVESAGRVTTHTADVFVLATGGTGSGGIVASPDGSLEETVFRLAVTDPGPRAAWARPRFLGPEPQPISLSGVRVNEKLQPFSDTGDLIENIFVTASNLPGWDPVREGNGEGVALATGFKAATEAMRIVGQKPATANA